MSALHYRRFKNVFRTRYIQCARGKVRGGVAPVFSAERQLDPSAHLFALPDRAWGWTATFLGNRIADGFEQTVTRVPVYRLRGDHFDTGVYYGLNRTTVIEMAGAPLTACLPKRSR